MGWIFGGPIGSVLGFISGTVVDSLELNIFRKAEKKSTMSVFSASLLGLIAAVMKADVPVVKQELDLVKSFLKQNFGENETGEALVFLKELLKQNNSLIEDCSCIRNNLDYSSRLQFTHFLYNLANVDGHVTPNEQNLLNTIARNLKVNISDKRSVGSVIVQEDSIVSAYEVLGVHRTTSIIDIKKAYRNLAIKYHPDKVAFLDDNLKKAAKDKFQQLTRAYEIIKKDRHFS